MRKSQREIKDFDEILKIIDKCATLRLGLYGEDFPYVVPLSYGYAVKDGKPVFYFHCATEGKKIDLIERDNRACAELDILNGYVDTGHSLTADFESVMCFGRVYRCEGEEKVEGIRRLLSHCGYPDGGAEECAAMPIVAVYRFETENFSAKRRFNAEK
ncbi:MAG: pyridoxamine 5'-phosphate oxidase family protein [Candidatus Coproplasma sp.]